MELAKLIKVLSSLELPGGIIFLLSVQWFKQQQNKSINLIIKFYAYLQNHHLRKKVFFIQISKYHGLYTYEREYW